MTQTSLSDTPTMLLTISDVMKALNLGRTKIYELIEHEGLPIQRFGRAVRVSREALQAWLKEREKANL